MAKIIFDKLKRLWQHIRTGESLDIDKNNKLTLMGFFNNNLEINSGSFSFSAQSNGRNDIFLAKISDNNITNIKTVQPIQFSISPNPASIFIRIILEQENKDGIEFSLFNQLGQEVKRATLNKSINQIDVNDLPNGTYMAQLRLSTNETTTKKIVVQK